MKITGIVLKRGVHLRLKYDSTMATRLTTEKWSFINESGFIVCRYHQTGELVGIPHGDIETIYFEPVALPDEGPDIKPSILKLGDEASTAHEAVQKVLKTTKRPSK